MKKNILTIFLICAVTLLSACSKNTDTEETSDSSEINSVITSSEIIDSDKKQIIEPDLMQIRSICELATLECCYNNVAKSTKQPGTGLAHIGEKERAFWIEYSGTADIGIEMSEIKMDLNGSKITVTIPQAKILRITVDHTSITDDSFVVDADNKYLQKNPITSEDQTTAIAVAQEQIKESFENNTSLLFSAQDRAKKLIENYINQIGNATDVSYEINWIYE